MNLSTVTLTEIWFYNVKRWHLKFCFPSCFLLHSLFVYLLFKMVPNRNMSFLSLLRDEIQCHHSQSPEWIQSEKGISGKSKLRNPGPQCSVCWPDPRVVVTEVTRSWWINESWWKAVRLFPFFTLPFSPSCKAGAGFRARTLPWVMGLWAWSASILISSLIGLVTSLPWEAAEGWWRPD